VNILALDLGTKTGWAVHWPGITETGVQTFDVKRGESPGMRYIRFNEWLLRTVGPLAGEHRSMGLIVYEQTHQRGGAATEVAAGFATRVQEFCAKWGIEHTAVHTGTLKKFAAGSGNAGKADMIEAAANLGGRFPEFKRVADDFMARYNAWCDKAKPNKAQVDGSPFSDEADALCLLAYVMPELAAMAAEEEA